MEQECSIGKKIPLFFNNAAHGSHVQRSRAEVEKYTDIFEIIEPTSREDMIEQLREQIRQKTPIVAVAGGDGTLNSAAQVLCNTDTKLAVIPAGTANVFAREIGIGISIGHAVRVMKSGKSTSVDLFALNGTPFLQMAGIGLDSRTVERTSLTMKKRWKALAYVLSGMKVCTEKLPLLSLHTEDGRTVKGNTILFGNGKRYGGPLSFFRKASNSDGMLDVVVIRGSALMIAHDCIRAGVNGGFRPKKNHSRIQYLQIKSGSVSAEVAFPFEADGDNIGHLPINITHAGTLRVFIP